MKTGYLAQHGRLPGAILIVQAPTSIYLPRYKALYPGTYKDEVDRSTFEWCYRHLCLSALDPQQVWDDLHDLALDDEPVLVSVRRDVGRCHRRLVSAWFERSLGVKVPEVDGEVIQLGLLAG